MNTIAHVSESSVRFFVLDNFFEKRLENRDFFIFL